MNHPYTNRLQVAVRATDERLREPHHAVSSVPVSTPQGDEPVIAGAGTELGTYAGWDSAALDGAGRVNTRNSGEG
jgi:hypothetical protein